MLRLPSIIPLSMALLIWLSLDSLTMLLSVVRMYLRLLLVMLLTLPISVLLLVLLIRRLKMRLVLLLVIFSVLFLALISPRSFLALHGSLLVLLLPLLVAVVFLAEFPNPGFCPKSFTPAHYLLDVMGRSDTNTYLDVYKIAARRFSETWRLRR